MKRFFFLLSFFTCTIDAYSQQPELMLPVGHMFQVENAFFTNKDKYIVTYAENVKIWEASSGKLVKSIEHTKRPESATLLDNNEFLIISYPDSIHFWNIRENRITKKIAGNDISVYEKSNRFIVKSFSDDNPEFTKNAVLFDLKTFKQLHEFDLPIVSFSEISNSFLGVDINKIKVYDSTFKIIYNSENGNLSGLSNDFRYLAILHDTTIDVVRPFKNELLHQITVDLISYYSVSFIPDSNIMLIKVKPMNSDKGYAIQNENSYFLSLDLKTFKIKHRYAEQQGNIEGWDRTNQLIVTSSTDSTIRVWNIHSGKLISAMRDPDGFSKSVSFSSDKKLLVTSSNTNAAKVWDIEKGSVKLKLEDNTSIIKDISFSKNGKLAIFQRSDDLWLWDIEKGMPVFSLPEDKTKTLNDYFLDSTNKKLYVSVQDKGITTMESGGAFSFNLEEDLHRKLNIYSVSDGKLEKSLPLPISLFRLTVSPDGKNVAIGDRDSTGFIMNMINGSMTQLKNLTSSIQYLEFINDGRELIAVADKTFTIYNSNSGQPISTTTGNEVIIAYGYSPVSGFAVFITDKQKIIVRDIRNNRLVGEINSYEGKDKNYGFTELYNPTIDRTGRFFCIKSLTTDSVLIIDPGSSKLFYKINAHRYVNKLLFNSKNNLLIAGNDGNLQEWNLIDNKFIASENYNTEYIDAIRPDNKYLLGHIKTGVKIINIANKKINHHLYLFSNSNYIITDDQNRYDGTEGARKQLYFTCGTELIELDQVKDQLWVPGLAARLIKGETINAKTLADLNLCGYTPEITNLTKSKEEYKYQIIPRRGGLGETVLYVNGIEAKRFTVPQLQKKQSGYELAVKKVELEKYFIAGSDNPVTIKSYTAANDISSRGLIINEDKTKQKMVAPNLFAVIVGISDYKGTELDLKYAAKDASDISNALAGASRKLLNTDGTEHVFIYNLTTAADHYLLPEKNSIKKTLEEIGKKATANDVLIIFFAGHGVMDGADAKKQFYFLTADASAATAGNAIAEVGISTSELSEWMKPSLIKAQKRIMIFDACNSGQAIKDFVQLGKPQDGYLAARNDDNVRQVKAIEKLNNQSGLFILAASASNQNAYELGRYSQGLLTYSLLKVIKQQPDILENGKYLDVSNWLNAAKKMVTTLAGETGARQEPQLNASNNFNIGVVDDEVRNKILLPLEKPMFNRSNFQNAELKIDNLKLRSALDKELNSAGSVLDAPFMYSADYEGADAYTLTGDYTIAGDIATVNVLLVKGGTERKYNYEIKGVVLEIKNVAETIIKTASDWLLRNK